jgi:pimeloyl-ACP methyl ester carboxylesterase
MASPQTEGGVKHRLRPFLRVAVGAAAALLALAAVGLIYEAIASRDDAEENPPPGQILEVFGRDMHLHCLGVGAPTVLLEAGLGESSASWGFVQEGASLTTRVCSYDRAGYGWSEPASGARTFDRVVGELRELLYRARENGPFVVVGHSLGAFSVRLFQDRYPELVTGVVLLDLTDDEGSSNAAASLLSSLPYRVFQLLGRLSVVRLFGSHLLPAQAGRYGTHRVSV